MRCVRSGYYSAREEWGSAIFSNMDGLGGTLC